MMVSDEEKRWLVVGIAMNKVAAPVLRDFIKQGMDTHYANNTYCHGLASPCVLNTLTYHYVNADPNLRKLKFKNINNNHNNHGDHKNLYNYSINSSVDLAKLFLPNYLAEFSGFDESLDMSAILRLLGCNNPAAIFHSSKPSISIQLSADDVRENVRNTWGHCNVTDWTEVFFNDCFSKLETLVRSLGLTSVTEKMALDQLSDWETKGCQLCMGHAVDQNLLSFVQQDVKGLVKIYKTTEESLAQQRVELTEMQDQQSATRAQLENHDDQLTAVLEWKEQQMKENKEILLKLMSVEKMLTEELLIRVEGVERRLTETDEKVEQLQQGFAKTGDKVEQLEQEFAKVEKDVLETGNKVKQLEEAVSSQRIKENRPASADETFDVKSCRNKLAEHYKRTATVPTSVWTKKSPVDIHQIYTRLSWVKEEQTPAGSSQSELKHYTDVFTANRNDVVPKRILVQGQTGIGKSTFVKKLAVDWAELDKTSEDDEDGHVSEDEEATFQDCEGPSRSSGKDKGMSESQKESLKKFELVLVINLKEVSKCRSLKEIVHSCSIFPDEESALVDDLLSYLTKNQEKVLLVFDGYDEYRCGSNSDIYEIFKGKKLRNCCVLITTRISKADELREFKDVHAEITGFSEVDRVEFMIKLLGSKGEAEKLSFHLWRKKLTDLTRVPLLLLFFCTLWKRGKLKAFPENKTKLYLEIVQYVLDYNQGKDSPARFGKVHNFKDILTEIGKVALDCLLKDDHVFDFDQLSTSILCEESLVIGLLQVTEYAENLRPSGMVSFIHKSIQEFLAAWYITNSCVPDGNLSGIEHHARTLEDFLAWENVFQFVCGLSDHGARQVFQHLTSVRISDPTLDLSKIVPDVENEAVVPLCIVTDRHKSFSNVVYDSFQEVNSKAEHLSNWFDCNGGIFLESRNRPLEHLIPKVDDFTKIAHSRGARVIFRSHLMPDELLKFLDCWHKPMSNSESSEGFTVEDFLRKFEYIFFNSSFSSILCFCHGRFQFYLTGLELRCDANAKHFAETVADPLSSPSEQSCLKFLTSLRCWCSLSGESCRALGAAIRDFKHLKRIEVHECDDSVNDLLEHVRNPSKCSLEIGSFFMQTKEGNIPKCDLTTSGAMKFARLISMFVNIITLSLGLSNCSSAAVDTLVASITHHTLEVLVLHGVRLTPAAVASLGRLLPEMSSVKVLQITGVDGSILETDEIEALFGGFNRTLPLSRLTLSDFSVRGSLSPLARSLPFFPTLRDLKLEKLNVDERCQCSLLQNFGFIPNLKVMKLQSKSLGHPCCCTIKVNTGHGYKLGDYKTLELNGISLTQSVAAAFGQSLPEMPLLQELELTGVDGGLLKAEEMEELFGGFNRTMPLCKLTLGGFRAVGGWLAPLTKCFRFFPNLTVLKLEKLNMDENDQCSLLESLPFIRNLTALRIQTRPLGDADCCTAELNTYDYFRPTASKSLTLKGIILTQAATATLGQSLPEMVSLQALEITGVRPESILQAEGIEALFCRFNGVLPLWSLTLRDFSLTGSIAPLTKSFCFFPNLMVLNLAKFDMDEHNLCGLLENLRFTPNLMELRLEGKTLDLADCRAAKAHTVDRFPMKTLKELILYNVCLTPAVATALGRILPEMSSLQEFVLTGLDGSVVTADEIEALFGGLNETLALHSLTFSYFSRGNLAPLIKSFRFLPNLRMLDLRGLNMDEHNLCGLIDSLSFIPNLKFLEVKGRPLADAHCSTSELSTMAIITHKTLEQLRLDGITLTPVSAALLGRSLPEMSSLQVLELIGVDGNILQAKEMEALFGGLDKTLPLHKLTVVNFGMTDSLDTLCKSFRFFPNLRQLALARLNMNEQDVCSLLRNIRYIRRLSALKVQIESRRDACCYTEVSRTSEIHEKLHLNGISLTPAAAAALGRSLPEMSSLQELELTGFYGSILQAEEIEALFGGFNKTMLLSKFAFGGFGARGSLVPLIKCLRFFPNLREFRLERLNLDEKDQCDLLKSFGFIGNLTNLNVHVRRSTDLVSFSYYTSKLNTFDRLTNGRVEKRLKFDGINLTPAIAEVLGLLLPEMSSLQTLEVSGGSRSILEAEEVELLFGIFNKTLPLHSLTLSGFSVRGCLSPLYRSLHIFPSLKELNLNDLDMGEHDCCFLNALCCTAEVNARVCPAKVTYKNLKLLTLERISLTPAAAAALGRLLPEMSSLQVLQLTQMDGSFLQVEEMEALFGRFSKPMPLLQLTFSGFTVRGCLAPLFRSLRFFPSLIELDLEKLNMDKHDLNGLLESFQFIPNLQELNLFGNPLGHAVTSIVPHVINLKNLRSLWIGYTGHSEEDLNYVRDTLQQVLPELKINCW